MCSQYIPALLLAAIASCHGQATVYEQHFSTKTPYWSQQDPSTWTAPPATCTPVQIEAVIRHGARNPGKGDIKKLNRLQQLLKDNAETVKKAGNGWAINWTNGYRMDEQHLLIPQGEWEQYELAQRFRAHFPSIFDSPYTPLRYVFQSTQVSRTSQSGSAFVYGLFEGKGSLGTAKYQPISIWSDSLTTDRKLRFYDNCNRYLALHGDDPHPIKGTDYADRVKEFQASALYTSLASEVSARLGIAPNHILSAKELHAVYRACNYDTVREGMASPWCELLGDRGIHIMEYRDDMKQWWRKSHPYEENYLMSCPLLVEMVTHMDAVLAGTSSVRAHIRFAHAETVIPFVTMLGLFKDNVMLTPDLPYERIVARNFSSSYVSPYTANVVFVLYHCEGSPVVKLLLNEKEYIVPGCQDLYCPLNDLKKALHRALSQCHFDEICSVGSPRARPTLWDLVHMAGDVIGLYDYV